jgi:two-component system cell cycle response regulator DivK
MIKILIAEDNPVNRELLRELLEGRGYEVEEACDGVQALEMVASTRPALLLLDLGMPKLDGFGVIRKIRADPELADLPVMAVTAYAMRGDRENILDAGFDAYLSKPVSAALLTGELDRLLNQSGASRSAPTQSASAGQLGLEHAKSKA